MPTNTRYRESRTLVRPLHRLPGESREDFKAKVRLLRSHFEQFNVDVSDLCQWLMALRPESPKNADPDGSSAFWEYFLSLDGQRGEEDAIDRKRRAVFDAAAGIAEEDILSKWDVSPPLLDSIRNVAIRDRTRSAVKLFERMRGMETGHRQVLLKAAAEWIVARYYRGYQNWEEHRKHWEQEKQEWEAEHPELTEELREEFNQLFRELESGGQNDVRKKNPRICDWEHLKTGKDNCRYNGQRIGKYNHGSLCKKFDDFLSSDTSKDKGFSKKRFRENAVEYAELLSKTPKPRVQRAMDTYLQGRKERQWFRKAWNQYLQALGIPQDNLRRLPHCVNPREDECLFNKHTPLCTQYKRLLKAKPHLQAIEPLYRDWRRLYLVAPSRPHFRFPSAMELPMPKIFGQGWFEAEFDTSTLRVRLEGMKEGEFLAFGFRPWPADYDVQPDKTEITSVHISFRGARPRAGFRFETPHQPSRFGITQDEIDVLRSQTYPRQAEDQKFLDEARRQLLESWPGDARRNLRILAVDLGTSNAYAAVFSGTACVHTEPLKVVKLDRLYDKKPDRKDGKHDQKDEQLGLSKQHVGKHIDQWAIDAQRIGEKRTRPDGTPGTLGSHDLRKNTLHTSGMLRDWVRLNASQIIQAAERHQVDLIVIESMRDWKAPGYDKLDEKSKGEKSNLAFFSHGKIRHKVREKAVERGMRLITVPYLYSSQYCSGCGKKQEDRTRWRKNKLDVRNPVFDCEFCSMNIHPDENAARVVGRVFWGEILLPVKGTDKRSDKA